MRQVVLVAVWAFAVSALAIVSGVMLIHGVAEPIRSAIEPTTGLFVSVIFAGSVTVVVAFVIVAACAKVWETLKR